MLELNVFADQLRDQICQPRVFAQRLEGGVLGRDLQQMNDLLVEAAILQSAPHDRIVAGFAQDRNFIGGEDPVDDDVAVIFVLPKLLRV
jgi:hypothetical protein